MVVFRTEKQKRMIKVVSIAIISIVLLSAAFIYGGLYKTESLRDETSSLQTNLNLVEKELVEKESELNSSLSELNSTSIKKDFYENEFARMQEETAELEEENLQFKGAIGSAVRAVCCSFDEIQQGIEKDWGLSSSSVICVGDFKVDCGTGIIEGFD